MDPLPAIAAICREHNLWFHVDAAMSGTAALCPEFRHYQQGVEHADSYCFNPHKWMFTNFDCDCFYVADRKALINTLSILPEYLKNQATESGAVFDYRDWQIPLGRRFRSLKLWFVIRHYGVEGLQYHVRQHVEMAQAFAGWVRQDDRFEVVAPVPLNLVCFRYRGSEEAEPAADGPVESKWRPVSDAHSPARSIRASLLCGANQHHEEARGARMAAHPGGGGQAAGGGTAASL